MNRATSIYRLEVPSEEPFILVEHLLENCTLEVNGSSVIRGRANINFRAAGDEEAVDQAEHLAGGRHYLLHTGFGVSNRTVQEV